MRRLLTRELTHTPDRLLRTISQRKSTSVYSCTVNSKAKFGFFFFSVHKYTQEVDFKRPIAAHTGTDTLYIHCVFIYCFLA